MNRALVTVAAMLAAGLPGWAHRLDEYLQATILSVEQGQVSASIRLIPGVAVAPAIFANIDTNGDGTISTAEQRSYAARVMEDIALTADGRRLAPRLISVTFPQIEEMQAGLGEMHIELSADLPPAGSKRRIVVENHHQGRISVYLMNCLVPRDRSLRIVSQQRNRDQSYYCIDYVEGTYVEGTDPTLKPGKGGAPSIGFASIFRLGMRHIAEGTDHLLFLLALLLPAPLLAAGHRWAEIAGISASLLKILRIVTAFTVGHSVTLALAAFGVVRVPGRPVEILIAISILFSAVHALRPLFAGREAALAGFFGLIHGVAFATTIGALGISRWERAGSVLAFNLGIETMQLVVVAGTLPSLLLLSRTRGYAIVRVGGALLAGLAAIGWIAERLFGAHTPTDALVGGAARYAVWIALTLFAIAAATLIRPKLAYEPTGGRLFRARLYR